MSASIIWRQVTKATPCRICGRPDWCQASEDGALAMCRRAHALGTSGGRFKLDATSVPYTLFGGLTSEPGSGEHDGDTVPSDAPGPDPIKHKFERAEPGVLDAVYRALLDRCSLTFAHESGLLARGYERHEIERRGYKSKPDIGTWATLKADLMAAHKRDLLRAPGFCAHEHVNDKGEPKYRFRLDGPDSLMLPLRDRYGRIVGVQLDLDRGEPKYLPLTSYGRNGSKAALVVHVPLHDPGEVVTLAVRLVGGVYKADLATLRTGVLTLSAPSEYGYAACLPDVMAMGPAVVSIAPDADARTNPQVASALADAAVLYQSQGYQVAVEAWAAECGKGIDDVIAAGHVDKIEALTGVRLWEWVRDVLVSSNAPPNAAIEARLVLATLGEEPEAKSLFAGGVVRAVATLDPSTPEYHGVHELLVRRLSKGELRSFDAALKKEKEKLQDAEKQKRLAELEARGQRVFRLADHKELRDAVLDDLTPVGGTRFDHDLIKFAEGTLWKYDQVGGLWAALPDSVVKNKVATYSGSPIGGLDGRPLAISAATARGVLELVQSDREDESFFDGAVPGIAFRNGFVTIDPKTGKRQLRAHSRTHRARVAYPFDYQEAGATPTRYLAFLDRLCKGKVDEEKVATSACLTEHLGACIAGIATKFEKALFLLGKGGTGNSTIVNVHIAAMPKGSVCSILPQTMENTFHLAQLAGRLLNAIDDLPKDELRNSGKWKSTITGGQITAEHKHKTPFTFHARAGHVMGCNTLPATSDTTRGFRRRVVVLQFTSIIEDSENNRNLTDELGAETPALVSYCLEQLSKAIERNSLTVPGSSELLVDAWLRTSAPIETFHDDCIRVLNEAERKNPKLWTQAHALYVKYVEWAKETGHTGIYSETTFGEWIKGKLGIQATEWAKAPFKREDGRFYPVALTDAEQRAAAMPPVSTPEEDAEIEHVLSEASKASSYVN